MLCDLYSEAVTLYSCSGGGGGGLYSCSGGGGGLYSCIEVGKLSEEATEDVVVLFRDGVVVPDPSSSLSSSRLPARASPSLP